MDNTPLAMAQKIENALTHIKTLCKELDEKAKKKAECAVAAECALDIAIVKLEADGCKLAVIRDRAKAQCKIARLNDMLAESGYKSLVIKIEAAKAILNGIQSQNRHLEIMQ